MGYEWGLGPGTIDCHLGFPEDCWAVLSCFQSHAVRFLLYVYCRVDLIRWRVTAVIVLTQSSGSEYSSRRVDYGVTNGMLVVAGGCWEMMRSRVCLYISQRADIRRT